MQISKSLNPEYIRAFQLSKKKTNYRIKKKKNGQKISKIEFVSKLHKYKQIRCLTLLVIREKENYKHS